ncbi:MAG TPA: hypothetical protein VER39_10495 [Nocardioidaceae bacterium]|nr:hypothetical protein [Nocardioidaceae bacterium]
MPGDAYYWAGGRKVALHGSSDVVIDVTSAAGAQLAGSSLDSLRAQGRALSATLLLVPEAEASAALGDTSASVAGVHPVYRSDDGALVVVLPEVRVESSDPRRLADLGRSLSAARVRERSEERLVLEPVSGRGADALRLANMLAESRAAEVTSARFLRVVARPGPG